jgi:hypothetical protein
VPTTFEAELPPTRGDRFRALRQRQPLAADLVVRANAASVVAPHTGRRRRSLAARSISSCPWPPVSAPKRAAGAGCRRPARVPAAVRKPPRAGHLPLGRGREELPSSSFFAGRVPDASERTPAWPAHPEGVKCAPETPTYRATPEDQRLLAARLRRWSSGVDVAADRLNGVALEMSGTFAGRVYVANELAG